MSVTNVIVRLSSNTTNVIVKLNSSSTNVIEGDKQSNLIIRKRAIEIIEITRAIVQFNQVGSGGVSDGDKGDITVSGSGTNWIINALSVTLSKLAISAYSALNFANTLVQRNANGSFAVTNIDFATLSIPNVGRLTGSQLTTSSTNPDQLVDSFDITQFRSAKYLVQIESGSDTHVSKL